MKMTATLGTFIIGECVVNWAYRMEIIELSWNFMNAQVHGGLEMMLKHMVASKANTWKSSGRQMQTVTITLHGTIACQGDHVTAITISCTSAEVIFLRGAPACFLTHFFSQSVLFQIQ